MAVLLGSIGVKRKSGNVSKIEKQVESVNALIIRANQLNLYPEELNQSYPSRYKYYPFKYRNGVLYESFELYNFRTRKWEYHTDKTTKSRMEFDNPLNYVSRIYKKRLKEYDKYGY